MIKYNVKTVNDWLYNSNPIKKLYYNGMVRYRRIVANGQPTPPVFDGKWKATYQDGHVESAECGSSSGITRNEINLSNLVSVEIGDCVTSIGERAFGSCTSLTSVTIPDSVTSIGKYAFQYCSSLPIIDNIRYADTYAIEATNGRLTTYTLKNNIRFIGDGAFNQCYYFTSITIPDSVTSIGIGAFGNCNNLTSIDIPNSVTTIGNGAFQRCRRLTNITVEAVTPPTLGSNAFDNTSSNLVIYVPDESVDAYKTANRWSSYASIIKPISEKPQ